MTKICLTMGIVVLVIAGPARAQHHVGGYYLVCPIGAQWNDPRCIRQPEPAAESERGPMAPVVAPRSAWGSVYIDLSTGSLGATTEAANAAEAEEVALARCEKNGSRHCEKQATFSNQCVVVAWPQRSGHITTQTGATMEAISRAALAACEGSGDRCDISFSSCAFPN